MGSSRLPGKVLADIQGKPALSRLLNRLRSCDLIDDVIVATSTNTADDPIAQWADMEAVELYRGSEDDVLLRVVEAQKQMCGDVVVEICGDMILLDPELIDVGIKTYLENECDVVTTTCKRSYPLGIDVLVFGAKALEWVAQNIFDQEVREHVSLYFFQNSDMYRIMHLFAPKGLCQPGCRFVLDYPEDLQFMRAVYGILEPDYGDLFGAYEIISLLKREPHLASINKSIFNIQ